MLIASAGATQGSASGGPQTLDRMVASIGRVAITQSDVEREYRLETLIDQGRLPSAPPDAAALDRVRDRLIDQALLDEQVKAEAAAPAGEAAAASWMAQIRKQFTSQEAFDSALRELDMDETQLRRVLEGHERSLAMIDRRLRPAASPEQAEIAAYYRGTFVPDYAKRGQGAPPPLEAVESRIQEILVQQKIDSELEVWLKELRSSHQVKVYSP